MGVFQLVVLLQGGRGRSGAVSLAGLFSAPAARKGTPADEDVSHMLAQDVAAPVTLKQGIPGPSNWDFYGKEDCTSYLRATCSDMYNSNSYH